MDHPKSKWVASAASTALIIWKPFSWLVSQASNVQFLVGVWAPMKVWLLLILNYGWVIGIAWLSFLFIWSRRGTETPDPAAPKAGAIKTPAPVHAPLPPVVDIVEDAKKKIIQKQFNEYYSQLQQSSVRPAFDLSCGFMDSIGYALRMHESAPQILIGRLAFWVLQDAQKAWESLYLLEEERDPVVRLIKTLFPYQRMAGFICEVHGIVPIPAINDWLLVDGKLRENLRVTTEVTGFEELKRLMSNGGPLNWLSRPVKLPPAAAPSVETIPSEQA